jgi:hypothetical protein
MGVAFHPDGRTALVANHGAGRITVVDLKAGPPHGRLRARRWRRGRGVLLAQPRSGAGLGSRVSSWLLTRLIRRSYW